MAASHNFSCCVIGETTLALQCCEKLLERGHAICGIVSPNPEIRAWAAGRGIPHDAPPQGLNGFLHNRPCDYLFSIVNNAVLPPEVLGLPRRMAVNFHDAPLPRYGGIHATSWAIMNREQAHGITWHEMTPQIDGGGVLKQKVIPVTPTDTALSLNMRCYQKAVEAFGELIDELAAGTAAPLPQDLSQRTYFGRYRRPELGCLIDWSAGAAEVEAFVRSLDFGPYPNALGVPKLLIGDEYYIVNKLHQLDSRSCAAPGTVLAADDGGLTVATADFDVRITGLATMEGTSCRPEALARAGGIRPGLRLMPPGGQLACCLTEIYTAACRHEEFWHAELRGLQPLALPDMRLHARSTAAGFAIYLLEPPPELISTALQLLPGAKPWHIMGAVFAAFLARHTGSRDIHLGLQDSVLDEKIEGLEGLFAGCLPLRLTLDLQQPLAACCRAALDKLAAIERCGTYTRDLIARQPDLRPQAGQGLPLRVRHARSLAGLQCSGDAALELVVSDQGACLLRIDAAAIDPAYGASIKNQLAAFLSAAAAGFTLPLEQLPLADEAQRQAIVEGWNDTTALFAGDACMHELFERQAQSRPDSTATVFDGTERSYAALNRQANGLAWRLKRAGVGRGCLVGICLDRSHDLIAALLAIFKAGGAYVPLEPTYPVERIATIVRSAGITVIISQEKHARLAVREGVRTVMIDVPDAAAGSAQEHENPPRAAEPGDLAYIIYTSGSTGAPKGVMVSHRPFINLFEWCCRTCGFGPDDSVLFTTSLGFDLSVFDIFGMLGCGGRIHIAGDAERRDASRLAHMLCNQEITFWDSAPAALQLLVPALKAQPRPVANRRLRQIFLSGDWIPVTLPDDIREVFPAAQVMSLGGATEATVWSNYFPVNRVEPHWRSIPYGRPLQNCRYYILDQHLQVCPPGVTGDLYIAGECLSMGYRNEAELTARSFVADPFRQEASGRMYRTGDLARFFPDGTMEFLGRSDFQVKVRGYRIELGEIEHVLRRHPAVKEAVVAVQTGAAGDQKLVAYLTTAAGGPVPAAKELRSYAGQFLAEYMVPNLFVWLEAMPVTANGKLDRRQLPWPIAEAAAKGQPAPQQAAPVPAQPDLEAVLAEHFREILGLSEISPEADFFDLGVTSLNLILIAEKLHEELGLEVTVETFLDHSSILRLADHIGGREPRSSAAPARRAPCSMTETVQPKAAPEKGPQLVNPAALPGPAAPSAQAADILRSMQITLPAEAFTDPAVLEEVTARVRLAFGDTAHTAAVPVTPGERQTARVVQSCAAAQPAGDVEALAGELAACFLEVLKISTISPSDDFFDLGASSLNLIEIAELLHERKGIEAPLEVFLDHTTLHSLAQYLAGMLPEAAQRPETGEINRSDAEQLPAGNTTARDSGVEIKLAPVSFAPDEYEKSACCRSFAVKPVPLRSLSRLLALLKEEAVAGESKYLYPSAGGLNAVQTYLYIKKDGVEGVPAGIYYYHPAAHQLMAIGEGVIPQAIMHPANRPVFEKAGFCIFLIAQLSALRPVYDCLSPALALLDAGYMIELLMSRQAAAGLGLCPLAGTDFSGVRGLFSLDETHLFMACLAGGLPGGSAEDRDSPDDIVKAGLTGHFAGPVPDWACLRAVAAGALDCLNVLTPEQHEGLHRSRPHLRKFTRPQALPLEPAGFLHNQYVLRSTQRSFVRRAVPFAAFSKFMALLRLVEQNGGAASLYDSAAGVHAVEVYIHIKAGAVEQLPEGIYRYDQTGHRLRLISAAQAAELRQAHFPRNRAYFAEAGFSIFCIADMGRIEPLAGSQGLQLAMLEAGCIGQVLMDHQAQFGMGVCPIGAMRFDGLRSLFGLGQRQVLLHSFLCGPVDRPAALLAGLVPLAAGG